MSETSRTTAGPGHHAVARDRDARRSAGKAASALLLSLMSWLSLATCAILASFTLPDAVGGDQMLSLEQRTGLVARELSLLLLPALLPGLAFLVGAPVLPGGGKAARALAAFVSTLLFFTYILAWGAFQFVGRFPDLRALIMFASDSVQIVEHALHMDAAAVTTAFAGSVLAAAIWSVLLFRVPSANRRVRLAVATLGALATAASLALASRPLTTAQRSEQRLVDPEAGVDMLVSDFLAEAESTRTGPLLRVRSSLHESSRVPTREAGDAALAKCSMAPIEPTTDWLRRVPGTGVRRWNVILIEVESLRNDQLQSFGGSRRVMPTLDALASEGLIFTRHYTLSSHSNYADIPPLSSHYPLRSPWYHIYPENPPYPRVLIYDLLHALGYRTAIVSSQNENWGGMANYLRTPGLDDLLHSENFDGRTYIPPGDTGFHAFADTQKKSGKVDDSATVGRAMAWLDDLPADQPFFLYLNLQNSHVPYETPATFPAPFPRPPPSMRILFNHIPPKRVAEVKNAYSNSLAYVDSQIARLFEHLRRSGRWDDTVLVVGGDNGEAFLEHGFSAHANALYDEVVHTPVVIRAPGLAPGVDSRLAGTLDLPPTMLELLGLPAHPSFQGRSLLGPAPTGAREIFLVAQTPLAHQYAIVRDRHKLIEDQRTRSVFLYDLLADPGELTNLADRDVAIVASLSARLDLWVTAQLAYYGDPARYCCSYPPNLPE